MESKNVAIGAVLLSSFLWGSSFVVAGYGVGRADPMLFLLLRFIIATPLVVLLMPYKRALANRLIWVLGALNAAAFIMQYVALGLTTATNVALLISMDLVFVGIASAIFLGERGGWQLGLSVALGFAGVLIVELGAGELDISSKSLQGDMLAIGAAFCWTAYIVLSKKALTDWEEKRNETTANMAAADGQYPREASTAPSNDSGLSAEELTAGVCVATIVPLMVVLPFIDFGYETDWPVVLGLAAYLAVFTTILAYLLWYKGLKLLSATTTSVLLLLEIAFAAILAIILLGERPTVWTVIGGGMICTAAAIAAIGSE